MVTSAQQNNRQGGFDAVTDVQELQQKTARSSLVRSPTTRGVHPNRGAPGPVPTPCATREWGGTQSEWWEGGRTGGWSGVRRAQHAKNRLTWTTGAERKGGLSRSRDGRPASASSHHHHRWWKMAGAGRTWRKHASTDRSAAARQWAPGGTSGVENTVHGGSARDRGNSQTRSTRCNASERWRVCTPS